MSTVMAPTTVAAPQPMMTQSLMMPQLGLPTAQSMVAVPNYEYVLPSGGVIAPGGGADYQSASGSYYFQPNTPFVFYPEEPKADGKAGAAKRDVKVSKKKGKKKKSCGCC